MNAAGDIELEPSEVAERRAQDPELQLIDVREPYEHEAGHVPDTRHIPLTALSEQAQTLQKERPVVFNCRVGSRSLMAAQALRAAGYEAYSMAGGLLRWEREGRELAPDGGRVADH